MQNMNESQTTEAKEDLKDGKYDFLISGILTKDANGYALKAKNGNAYSKIKFIIMDGDRRYYLYHLVFGAENLKEIVAGIGNPALTHIYESDPKNFDKENLIGEGGKVLTGHNKAGYPKIECFIKSKPSDTAVNYQQNQSASNFKQELEAADGVPF